MNLAPQLAFAGECRPPFEFYALLLGGEIIVMNTFGTNDMKINKTFNSLNATDLAAQSEWWSKLLERAWDRQPRPDCHEWDLTESVLFQVLDNPKGAKTTVTLLIDDLDAQVARLRSLAVQVPDPSKVEGFDTLRYCQFHDPEGNEVGLLEGR